MLTAKLLMRRQTLVYLGLLVFASGVLSVFMLERDHGWGDDFAGYVMQAQSIISGRMAEFIQRSTFTAQVSSFPGAGPITYPWGFPLMLAPAIAIFGMKILALKLVLTVCYLAFLVAFFFLLGTRLTLVESLLLTAVLAFNPGLLQAQNEVISDIPFLLLSTLGLFLIERYINSERPSRSGVGPPLMIGLAVFTAAFTRQNGFLLLLPLGIAQLLHARQYLPGTGRWPRALLYAGIPYLVLVICYSLQAVLLPSEPTRSFVNTSLTTVWRNLGYYFWLPGEFAQNTVFQGKIPYIVLLLFFCLSLAKLRTRDMPILLYGAATIILYTVFPGMQGIRYIYPFLPIFLLFTFEGMKLAAGWLKPRLQNGGLTVVYIFWAGLAVVSLVASVNFAWANMSSGRQAPGLWGGAFSKASTAMFDFVRHHTPADSVVIFFKPRAMRLLTNRDSFMTLDCASLPQGDYMVTVEEGDTYNQISPQEVETCNPSVALIPVYTKDDFIVYSISPAP